jgi:PhoH-like ATPase
MKKADALKTFVLDTNVLLHNPAALTLFKHHEIVIPFDVIEELDKFKSGTDDLARNARSVIRQLDELREDGSLTDGVKIKETGGTVRIAIDAELRSCPQLHEASPDNRMICLSYNLKERGDRVIFVSKDINARIKAHALGVNAEDFAAQKVDFDTLYTGWREWVVPAATIDKVFTDKHLPTPDLQPKLAANEFVLLKDETNPDHTALTRYKPDAGGLVPLRPRRGPLFGIMPRNLQQTMALDLLLDDNIKLVSLIGSAGTGKTLLALAAGLSKVLNDHVYTKLLCARPIMPLGRDIGYLPGDKDEKLTAWMQPIFDNVGYLLSQRVTGDQHDHGKASLASVEAKIKSLMDSGQIVLEPLTYIRGRSIPNQFMIVDESQNLTPHEVKTIASRVGEGTKLILTGDATQIDNPYLDDSSNGLSYLVERLKGKDIVGHITLARSERSELASLITAEL